MTEVRFPEYRKYSMSRREANDAMIALMAGPRFAAHTLQLTEGSQRLLPEMFPAVPHIERFNLRTDIVRTLLLDADAHLGAVAVPYALAIHEDFVITCLAMLKGTGCRILSQKKAVRAWNMHEVLFRSVGVAAPSIYLEQFHVLRHMRTCRFMEVVKPLAN